MTTLLLAEHDNKSLKDSTNKALTAAKALGGDVHILVAGKDCKAVADAAAKLDGVKKVLLADGASYEHFLAEPLAALIVSLAGSYDAIASPATSNGKNVMPRVAALLDVMQISDVSKVVSADTFERPVYAGNAIQIVKSKDAKKVLTIRTSTFAAAGEGGSAPVETVTAAADPGISSFVGEELSKSDRPELTSAKIIISGGRAMQNRENFTKYIEPVADLLGAGDGRLPRRGRRRLRAERLAGRPDRQGGGARALHRGRNFRRHPASCRDERLQGHCCHQQGRGSADFPGRRLWPGRRPLPGAAGTAGRIGQDKEVRSSAENRLSLRALDRENMAHSIRKVGIIGAGQMGNGIAHVCALAGIPVVINDIAPARLKESLATINGNMARQVARKRINEDEKTSALKLISTADSYEGLVDCDLVIEAATEKEEVKRKIFTELCPTLKPETLVASNTSSISITRLASATDRPEKFIGIHFMNPVPLMELVELIRGIATADATFEAAKEFVTKLHKKIAVSEDFPAFIVNRILLPMINEAIYTLYEGVGNVDGIDTAMKLGAHHPMGPLELADFIGLDTCLSVMQVLHEGLADSKYRPCPLLVKYVEAGWLGKKAGRGFYDYRGEKPVPTR